MMIKPSASIRNNYRKVADYCIETGQPVYLTNNGEGELVVMSIQAWEEERHRLAVEQELLQIEAEEMAGNSNEIPIDDVFTEIDCIIDDAEAAKL